MQAAIGFVGAHVLRILGQQEQSKGGLKLAAPFKQ